MKVLVCGGRDYNDYETTRRILSRLRIETIIHGGARGADSLGERYATENNIDVLSFPARWEEYGRSAGAIRNAEMLREGTPDLVVAFPGGKGTANMIKQAKEAGVSVYEVSAS